MTNFSLIYDHKIDALGWDNIHPFEKQIYIDLLISRINEKNTNASQGSGYTGDDAFNG